MIRKEIFFEKRMHARYQAKDYAFVVTRPHSEMRGQIIDISEAGLAFKYPDNTGDWTRTSTGLDIYLLNTGLFLDKINIRTISDIVIENSHAITRTVMRRRSVMFKGLTPKQKEQLLQFILLHTEGKLNESALAIDYEKKLAGKTTKEAPSNRSRTTEQVSTSKTLEHTKGLHHWELLKQAGRNS